MDRDQVERWFISRGVPHFIDGYDAARDIFTRSIPTLIGFYLLNALNALDIHRWSPGRNLVAAVENVVLLAVIYTVTSYAVIPLSLWALRHLISQLTSLTGLVAATPAAGLELPSGGVPEPVALSFRERLNLSLVLLFAQGVQITLVTATMGLFLTGLGVLTMGTDTVANWTRQDPTVLLSLDSGGGRDLVLTRELIEVSWFLAVITGFYFTVYLVTDETYRQEFRAGVDTELRQALAVRRAYRHALTPLP